MDEVAVEPNRFPVLDDNSLIELNALWEFQSFEVFWSNDQRLENEDCRLQID